MVDGPSTGLQRRSASAPFFLAGSALPTRWRGRRCFVVLETGFGLGTNFLATWRAWRADPDRSDRLVYVSTETRAISAADFRRAHGLDDGADDPQATALIQAWPAATPDLHVLDFEGGRVQLLLMRGDAASALSQLNAQADAVVLGELSPHATSAPRTRALMRQLARLSRPGATLTASCANADVREAARAAGFVLADAPAAGDRAPMTIARFAPVRPSPGPVGRRSAFPASTDPMVPEQPTGRAVIIGAGIAGAWTARALALRGWQCTVLDRHAAPASEASGNPAGTLHGIANIDDNAHARLGRAGALRAASVLAPWLADGSVQGALNGFIHSRQDPLPPEIAVAGYLQPLDAEQVQQRSGANVGVGWLYPGGGWVSPRSVIARCLQTPGVHWRGGAQVARVMRVGPRWHCLAGDGSTLAEGDVLILAGGKDQGALIDALSMPPSAEGPADARNGWPAANLRGQLTVVDSPLLPRIAMGGSGYAVPLPDGSVLCGATSHADDGDSSLRATDHAYNLDRLEQLVGCAIDPQQRAGARGRVAWRNQLRDRLPMVGAWPAQAVEPGGPNTQPLRRWPRIDGLYVVGGLGGRGLTWMPLLGEVLAAQITGEPLPLTADLVDAIDPARFVWRAACKPSPRD